MATTDYNSSIDLRLPLYPDTTPSFDVAVFTDINALFTAVRLLAEEVTQIDERLIQLEQTALTDAPEDGQTYGRKDGEWVPVTGGGGGGGNVTALAVPYVFGTTSNNYSNYTIFTVLRSAQLLQYPAKWTFKLRLQVASGNINVGAIRVLTTLTNSTAVIASTNITIGGSTTPVLTPPVAGALNDYQLDTINLQLEAGKDYYCVVYFSSTSNPNVAALTQVGLAVTSQYLTGNQSGVTTVPVIPAGTVYAMYDFRMVP